MLCHFLFHWVSTLHLPRTVETLTYPHSSSTMLSSLIQMAPMPSFQICLLRLLHLPSAKPSPCLCNKSALSVSTLTEQGFPELKGLPRTCWPACLTPYHTHFSRQLNNLVCQPVRFQGHAFYKILVVTYLIQNQRKPHVFCPHPPSPVCCLWLSSYLQDGSYHVAVHFQLTALLLEALKGQFLVHTGSP